MPIDGIALTAIGIAAGVLILAGWVNQIIHGYKTKSLNDVSVYLTILVGAGSILWLIYGIVLSDPYIIGTNAAALSMMVLIFAMKRRYDRIQSK